MPQSRAPKHRVKTLLEVDTASCMGVQRDAGQEQKASAHKRGLHGLKKAWKCRKTSPWQQGQNPSHLNADAGGLGFQHTPEINMSKKIEELSAACKKLKNAANRTAVEYIINCGEVNASDTVARSDESWERIATDTIGSMLSSGEYNHHVARFFESRGISY